MNCELFKDLKVFYFQEVLMMGNQFGKTLGHDFFCWVCIHNKQPTGLGKQKKAAENCELKHTDMERWMTSSPGSSGQPVDTPGFNLAITTFLTTFPMALPLGPPSHQPNPKERDIISGKTENVCTLRCTLKEISSIYNHLRGSSLSQKKSATLR